MSCFITAITWRTRGSSATGGLLRNRLAKSRQPEQLSITAMMTAASPLHVWNLMKFKNLALRVGVMVVLAPMLCGCIPPLICSLYRSSRSLSHRTDKGVISP